MITLRTPIYEIHKMVKVIYAVLGLSYLIIDIIITMLAPDVNNTLVIASIVLTVVTLVFNFNHLSMVHARRYMMRDEYKHYITVFYINYIVTIINYSLIGYLLGKYM